MGHFSLYLILAAVPEFILSPLVKKVTVLTTEQIVKIKAVSLHCHNIFLLFFFLFCFFFS